MLNICYLLLKRVENLNTEQREKNFRAYDNTDSKIITSFFSKFVSKINMGSIIVIFLKAAYCEDCRTVISY